MSYYLYSDPACRQVHIYTCKGARRLVEPPPWIVNAPAGPSNYIVLAQDGRLDSFGVCIPLCGNAGTTRSGAAMACDSFVPPELPHIPLGANLVHAGA